MNTSTRIFSNDPNSTQFNSLIGTSSGRKAKLGDPARLDDRVAGSVRQSHAAIESGMGKITKLADDDTRSVPERHEAARTVAEKTIAQLKTTANALEFRAKELIGEADQLVKERFAPSTDGLKAMVQHDVSKWIGERAKDKDGIATIRKEMKRDPDIAIALLHGKSYLMNLNHDVRLGLVEEAYRQHLPNEMAKIEKGAELQSLAAKYAGVSDAVRRGWFNKSLADKAASRVQV